MVGIVLHEVGHMTLGGSLFNATSFRYYNQSQQDGLHQTESFDQSQYWSNNEAFANNFAVGLAATIGADINEWHPAQGVEYVNPYDIYWGLL